MSGVAITASKSSQPPLIFVDHVFAADKIRAGLFGFLNLVALGDHQNCF